MEMCTWGEPGSLRRARVLQRAHPSGQGGIGAHEPEECEFPVSSPAGRRIFGAGQTLGTVVTLALYLAADATVPSHLLPQHPALTSFS